MQIGRGVLIEKGVLGAWSEDLRNKGVILTLSYRSEPMNREQASGEAVISTVLLRPGNT